MREQWTATRVDHFKFRAAEERVRRVTLGSVLHFIGVPPQMSSFVICPSVPALARRKPITVSRSSLWRFPSHTTSRSADLLSFTSIFIRCKEQWRVRVNNRYASPTISDDSSAVPIDVVADVKTERVVVLGGSGFVGSAICKAAVSKGIEVVSLSRSGRTAYTGTWVDQVKWVAGDVFYAHWDEVLVGATAVVSTLGGFGNEEQMKKINGEANILAVGAAKDYGIPKFVLISVHEYNLPSFLLSSGYFTGKRKAESEVLSKYPTSGVVLRPGFIYGKRKVDGFEVPLDLIGEPMERLLNATENFTKPLSSLPASDLLLAPPISVDDVAFAVVNAVVDDDFFGVFNIGQIKEAAAKLRV
ncbi:hypothetical protein HPP92_009014 [Vanilla planifolia]|uniref:NAD(P)-binding domain-containing protein n=1 Tax=Vanilla planifolia TaxID=51239 RepID=A0A835RBJ8_VANPL|nr:hypothetical protein HPP92_009014 [Vanilla planifolia]